MFRYERLINNLFNRWQDCFHRYEIFLMIFIFHIKVRSSFTIKHWKILTWNCISIPAHIIFVITQCRIFHLKKLLIIPSNKPSWKFSAKKNICHNIFHAVINILKWYNVIFIDKASLITKIRLPNKLFKFFTSNKQHFPYR